MPELPDITTYLDALERYVVGRPILKIRLRSLFVVRTFDPDLLTCEQKTVVSVRRSGKRIIWELPDDLFIVFHLMIAGRFHWKKRAIRPTRKVDLVSFEFEDGVLLMTEASQKKRASIHVVCGEAGLIAHQRTGIDVLSCSFDEFRSAITRRNHTIKRALTDPTILSGIGNAYSDEILHAAQLSPVKTTSKLTQDELKRLYLAVVDTLATWIEKLRAQVGDGFPEKVTAFHPDMAVHGKYNKPCPVCDSPVQRIVYATRETNYCAICQTNGKVLKDRSLSRLLKDDWPREIE